MRRREKSAVNAIHSTFDLVGYLSLIELSFDLAKVLLKMRFYSLLLLILVACPLATLSAEIPDRFLGSWSVDKSENFDEYLTAKGYGWFMRQVSSIDRHNLACCFRWSSWVSIRNVWNHFGQFKMTSYSYFQLASQRSLRKRAHRAFTTAR